MTCLRLPHHHTTTGGSRYRWRVNLERQFVSDGIFFAENEKEGLMERSNLNQNGRSSSFG